MRAKTRSRGEQLLNVAEMHIQLEEAEDILRALRAGEVDAVVVAAPEGERVCTLQSADPHYRLLVEAMNEGAVIMTGGGVVLYSNRAFAEMLKAPLAEIMGRDIRQFIVESDLPGYEKLLEQSQRSGRGKGEVTLTAGDGAAVPAYFSLSAIQLNEAQSVCAVITNLTEHKRTQELIASERLERSLRAEAEASRQMIVSVLESITDSFLTLDRDWRITDLNQRAASFFGKTSDELLGQKVFELFPQAVGGDIYKCYRQVMDEGIPMHFEAISNGAGQWFEVHLYPVDGGVSAYFRDITDRKRAEEEREQLLAREQEAREVAEEANRVKDDFLATLSHELRTPLNAILGWTELLGANRRDSALLDRAVEVITRNAKAQAQLIEDILDVSRIIAGKFHLEMRMADLVPIIDNVIESLQPIADANGVQLRWSIDPLVEVVSCDPIRLQQVIWNLLSNAIKFTPPAGQVEIKLERVDSTAQITVTDTGEGISQEFLPYVFDRFRQSDSSYARQHSGLGLGLAIAHHVTQLHGGTIEARSAGKGLGATFTVKLPLAEVGTSLIYFRQKRSEVGEQSAARSAPRLDGVQVLVVEDDQDTREALRLILDSQGASAKVAATVSEGFKVLERWQPDVIVSDIGMPDEDGYVLIERLRTLPPEKGGRIPAIALTGYVGARDGERALSAGYQIYLAKPIQLDDLIESITSLAGHDKSSTKP
ncbi:MAG TPA: ATP-binding protein [Blastocatellia bacterium]